MSTQTATNPPIYGIEQFDKGVSYGLDWHRHGDAALRDPTAQLIVDFIRENIIELHMEGYLDDARLADLAGFLTGWIIGRFLEKTQGK